MNVKTTYKSRKWLNPPKKGGLSAIEATIEVETGKNKKTNKEWGYLYGHLTISDCTRSVQLEFDVDDKKDISRLKQKLRTLISELEKFEKGFHEGCDKYLELNN